MAKKIKVSKKEALKQPDEFITVTGRAFKYIKENEAKFIIASVVVFIFVLIASFSVYYIKKVNTMGFSQLSKALDEGDITKRKKLLTDIKNMRFSDARVYASFFLSEIYKEENNIEMAKKELKEAEKIKDPYLRGMARVLMVDILTKKGKLDDALNYAKNVPKDTPKFIKDELLFKEALIYEKKNNLKEAAQIYKNIETSNPDFYLLKVVQSRTSL